MRPTVFFIEADRPAVERADPSVAVTDGERGDARFEFTTTTVGMPGDGGP